MKNKKPQTKTDKLAGALAQVLLSQNLSETGHENLAAFLRHIDAAQIHYTRYSQEIAKISTENMEAFMSPNLLLLLKSRPGQYLSFRKKVDAQLGELKKAAAAAGATVRAIQNLVYNVEDEETLQKIFGKNE